MLLKCSLFSFSEFIFPSFKTKVILNVLLRLMFINCYASLKCITAGSYCRDSLYSY